MPVWGCNGVAQTRCSPLEFTAQHGKGKPHHNQSNFSRCLAAFAAGFSREHVLPALNQVVVLVDAEVAVLVDAKVAGSDLFPLCFTILARRHANQVSGIQGSDANLSNLVIIFLVRLTRCRHIRIQPTGRT
jgi:hypothetical protein